MTLLRDMHTCRYIADGCGGCVRLNGVRLTRRSAKRTAICPCSTIRIRTPTLSRHSTLPRRSRRHMPPLPVRPMPHGAAYTRLHPHFATQTHNAQMQVYGCTQTDVQHMHTGTETVCAHPHVTPRHTSCPPRASTTRLFRLV
jgi:hypothetical protein